ncbi:MAG: class I SAM-dependent methyltransferase [Candidatus Hodarchaeales archaeon]|jgi:ubiquinone/menaquinone biosynthesis C-methylase UbiE
MNEEYKNVKESWDEKAEDWHIQVGNEGDNNRIYNSDPFLWKFLGDDLQGKKILDAGCATGYLSRKLAKKKAIVTGVDISSKMIEIAEKLTIENNLIIKFYSKSIHDLGELENDYFDIIVSNYVLMDTPDVDLTIKSFYKVMKTDGRVIIVITHPCFPQSEFTQLREDGSVHYKWEYPYIEEKKETIDPWGHFKSKFIGYNRPLSYYWKTFKKNNFLVTNFDEPVVNKSTREDLDDKKLRC